MMLLNAAFLVDTSQEQAFDAKVHALGEAQAGRLMTEGREETLSQAQASAPAAEEWGWYLYGIARRGALATTQPERVNGALSGPGRDHQPSAERRAGPNDGERVAPRGDRGGPAAVGARTRRAHHRGGYHEPGQAEPGTIQH